MKALVGAFNQEKALVGAFSVIVETGCGTDGSICGTSQDAWLVVKNKNMQEQPTNIFVNKCEDI